MKKRHVVLDTDAFNEIDDQFAIAYLLRSDDMLQTQAIYAAPFFNAKAENPGDGMEKSYHEIQKVLKLCANADLPVLRGSGAFLCDENTPVDSPAARDLAERGMGYTAEDPLYVIAIGAITNIASALLMEPGLKDRIVVVWLGGHAHHYHDTLEFNMRQDFAAARAVMGSGVRFVQLPCRGVVSEFATTVPELEALLFDKNPLADYLARNAARHIHEKGLWCKPLWDVTAVGWMLNESDRFMLHRKEQIRLPEYDGHYGAATDGEMTYVYYILRDALMRDLVAKLTR